MQTNRQFKQNIWERRLRDAGEHRGGVAGYCREQGLSISTFQYWRAKILKTQKAKGSRALAPFVAVTVEPSREDLPDPKWLASFAAELIRGLR